MRAIRAQKMAVELAGEVPVGDIASPTGEHAVVFEPAFQHARIVLKKNQTFDIAIRMLQGA